MKKILGILGLILIIWFVLSKTGEKQGVLQTSVSCKTRVLSTTAMIGDIVKQIGGGDVQSVLLIKGDDEKIDGADLVFFNGLHLEHGASLRHKLKSHPGAVSVGDCVFSKYPELILFEKGQLDPHIWMDVSLWAKIVEPIVEAFCKKDPENALFYQQRGIDVREKMLRFHEDLKSRLQQVPEERRYLVTSHDAFGYFTRAYLAGNEDSVQNSWKKRFAAPEGLAPDGQLGVSDLQKIIDYLAEYRVGVVFPESNVSRDSLKKIIFACKEKGISVRFSNYPLYGDCMGNAGSYLDMIEHNGSVLIREWQSPGS